MKKRKPINESNVVIVGLARNCAESIQTDILNIDAAFTGFKKKHWLIIESDSDDETVEKVQSLNSKIDINLISMGRLRDKLPKRTERISACRNEYINAIECDPRYAKSDYVIVADLDGINDGLTIASVQACWKTPIEWDACFANQSAPYYDIWALRHKLWSPNDCWQNSDFLRNHNVEKSKAHNTAVYARMITIEPTEDPIEVESAFGGLAIYKKELFNGCQYIGLNNNGEEVCEHVLIHRMMRKNEARLFIIPAFINGGWNEHSKQLLAHKGIKSFLKSFVRQLTARLTKIG